MKCKFIRADSENLVSICGDLGMRGKMALGPIMDTVAEVLENIRLRGDDAVREYTLRFDKGSHRARRVPRDTRRDRPRYASVDPDLIRIMTQAAENIRIFHEQQQSPVIYLKTTPAR